jgi:hypothetical protein
MNDRLRCGWSVLILALTAAAVAVALAGIAMVDVASSSPRSVESASPVAGAAAGRSCGVIAAFNTRFRITAFGATPCRKARSVVRRYDAKSRATGCGSYMGEGPCRVAGFACATSGYNRFDCNKGRHRINGKLAR